METYVIKKMMKISNLEYGSREDAVKVVEAYLVQDINDIIYGSNKTATEKLEEISKLPVSFLLTSVTRQC